jgi:predicted AAA+ superfamily ATPase
MNSRIIRRFLLPPDRSFFLFGARGTGKSTWLRETLPSAITVDLLDTSLLLQLTRSPGDLEAIAGAMPEDQWIVLDEVQKAPALLDEVHRLMEKRRWKFALCGSSARKLRRSGVNLLAGRAITLAMEPFSAAELGSEFDLQRSIEWGMLPFVQADPQHADQVLSAYVDTYLKEEVRAEGTVRSLAPFVRFLSVAGLLNGQVLNAQNVARDAAVPRATVDGYFSILSDTLLGHFLPSYRPGLKVRETSHPKFYWLDPGIARAAAGMLRDPADRAWKGFALETLIYHELRVHNQCANKHRPIAYYRTPAGVEVDFLIETRKRSSDAPPHVVCVEVKMAENWERQWERPMRSLAATDGLVVDRMFGVYTGTREMLYDGVHVLPVADFLRRLHAGEVF